jgi:hypothetical protein
MKTSLRLLFGAALCATSLLSLSAQQPTVPVPAPAPSLPPGTRQRTFNPAAQNSAPVQRAPLIPLLSRNYLLQISVTEGEKVTEYKLVTAASAISISTPGAVDGARSASINGQIEELEEGNLGVSLVVSLGIPDTAPVQPGVPPQPGRGQSTSEAFTASLRAKLGVEYPLFTTAARTYRLTLTPHENQAAAPPK